MTLLLGFCISGLLMVVASAQKGYNLASPQKRFSMVLPQKKFSVGPAQFNQRAGLKTECLGNHMKLTIDKSLGYGKKVDLDVINGTQINPLTPSLAATCGFRMDSNPWGNTEVFASLLNCYAASEDDTMFNINMRVRVQGFKSKQDVYDVRKTCDYSKWAPREIICNRNYMEVSVNRLTEDITALRKQPQAAMKQGYEEQWADAPSDAITSKYNIWRMVFFNPNQKAMVLDDALKAGYGVTTTKSRLVLRSGYDMPETYVENVGGVPMKMIRVTTYFRMNWSVAMLDTVAACPVGGLSYTDEMITWYFPRFNPIMSPDHKLLEMFMGIDGKRLDATQMAARGYSLTVADTQIVMTLPMGGPDGYFKSHCPGNQYHIGYSIEPMLELHWSEGGMEATRYKVMFPITTPPVPRLPQFVNGTNLEQKTFLVLLGPFLYDVELVNISFPAGVLTVQQANARGFSIQEQRFPNGSKTYSLQVPFADPFVVKTRIAVTTTSYSLALLYGFVIIPEYSAFTYAASCEATLNDIILPTVSGTCDDELFHITVAYGNMGSEFAMMLGTQELTPEQMAEYSMAENGTHLSLGIPFLASDVAFELMAPSSLRARLDMTLWEPVNKWNLADFSLACNFPLTMTECYNNGSISALAVKVESAAQLVPSQLTLRDPTCRPRFSNERFAYFSFNANSCGTTRTFYGGLMIYQNEISVGDKSAAYHLAKKGLYPSADPEYRVTISCFYTLNDTQTIGFLTSPPQSDPQIETGFGNLQVVMRLALDSSFTKFYSNTDYPVVQYLRNPLFFEVSLLQSSDPEVELILENCWATTKQNRSSTPSWSLIVNNCINVADRSETIFHPVTSVPYPSHVKRFEIKMFAFVQNNAVLNDQIFVHCDAVLCDVNQPDERCTRTCSPPTPLRTPTKGRRDSEQAQKSQLSSGQIVLSRTWSLS